MATITYKTREQWLVAAVKRLSPMFKELGHELPPVRVSVGFSLGRNKNRALGVCFHPGAATDNIGQVFVSPVVDNATEVLAILAHELVHAVNHRDGNNGHGAAFGKIARALGLEGKLTATVAGDQLAAKLATVAGKLGDYPHAALSTAGGEDKPKKQTTRMMLVVCISENGYKVRMTRQWIEDVGVPICPCHGLPMMMDE